MFYWRGQHDRVRWGFTDRFGGTSSGGFDSLNLGGHVGDDPGTVEDNRARVAEGVGVPRERLVFAQQCHGASVVEVSGPWGADPAPSADGMVSTTASLALGVLVADCTPVLLADPGAGVIGVVHAGRPGMTARIVDVAVARMRALGATDLQAVVGPSVCGRCYEVPQALREECAAVAPETATVSWTGTPAVDVAAGVVAQLRASSVAVQWIPGCTREEDRLYSYRRDQGTGRFAGFVMLEDS